MVVHVVGRVSVILLEMEVLQLRDDAQAHVLKLVRALPPDVKMSPWEPALPSSATAIPNADGVDHANHFGLEYPTPIQQDGYTVRRGRVSYSVLLPISWYCLAIHQAHVGRILEACQIRDCGLS